MTFKEFALHPAVEAGVKAVGYDNPTPIQTDAIPPVMNGRDVIGLAQTGTGKTAAFALPILTRLMNGRRGGIRALVVAPTRELAEQIHQAFTELGQKTNLRSVSIYGGVGITPQKNKLRHGADIVVACPGRLLDHIRQRTVSLANLEVLVLDEADHMFDMGFLPDIRRIIGYAPRKRQTLLFSATMPNQIRRLARDVLTNPVDIKIGATSPAETVRHALYPVAQNRKTNLLVDLLGQTGQESVLVFTRTKYRAKTLERKLVGQGFPAASLQGNLSQNKRQAALAGFRSGKFRILVATDIAARGIDVTRVSHVINFDAPSTPEAYIHRIGRTGRASRNGEAYTFVTKEDRDIVRAIDRALGTPVERRQTIAQSQDRTDNDPKRNPAPQSRVRPIDDGKATAPVTASAKKAEPAKPAPSRTRSGKVIKRVGRGPKRKRAGRGAWSGSAAGATT